jgi:hypothetical protein
VQEREEIGATFIGIEGWWIGLGINRIEEGEKIARAGVSSVISGWMLKMLRWPDSWGPHVSGWKVKARIPVRKGFLGCRPDLELGQIVSLGDFSCFFLIFFFCFLISFITFANLVQIYSNQFVNFSKNSTQHFKTVRNMFS